MDPSAASSSRSCGARRSVWHLRTRSPSRVATHGFGGGRLRGQDLKEVIAEVAGATFVAVVATLPILVFSEDVEQQVVPFVLALTIGVVSYVVERANGRTRTASVVFGVITLLAGLVAATVKNLLSAH